MGINNKTCLWDLSVGCHGSWKVKTEIWEQGGAYGCLQDLAEQGWGSTAKLLPRGFSLCSPLFSPKCVV